MGRCQISTLPHMMEFYQTSA